MQLPYRVSHQFSTIFWTYHCKCCSGQSITKLLPLRYRWYHYSINPAILMAPHGLADIAVGQVREDLYIQ